MVLKQILAIAMMVASAIVGQGEESSVASAGNAGKGAISDAKKSFDDLRAARTNIRENAPSGLPALSAPELTITIRDTKPARGTQSQLPKKNRNWLVDGVLGNAKASNDSFTPNRAESLAQDSGAVDPTDEGSTPGNFVTSTGRTSSVDAMRLSSPAAEPKHRPPSLPTQQAVANPLNQFMQSWISPQDRQLLLTNETWSGGSTTQVAAIDSTPSLAPRGSAFDRQESGRALESKHSARDNPYSAGQAPIAVPSSGQTQLPSVPSENVSKPSAGPPVNIGEAIPFAPNKPTAREFGKHDDNSKYFRQLNRF